MINCRNNLLAVFTDELYHWVYNIFHHISKDIVNDLTSCYFLRQSLFPFVEQWRYPQGFGLHINHTTSTNGSRRSHSQVLNLEHHGHMRGEGQDLPRVETQFLIIIEHSVHIFDPQSIDRPIKHDPMFLRWPIRTAFSYCVRKDSVSPLLSCATEHTVQLAHCYRFWVYDVGVYFVVPLVLQGTQGCFENAVGFGFASTGWAHEHETVSDLDCIVELNCFWHEGRNGLKMKLRFMARFLNFLKKGSVVNDRLLHSREQVHDNVLKQGQVIFQEFGYIDIP